MLSRGDEDARRILFKAIASRLSIPILSANRRISRVLAFLSFVRSNLWVFTTAPETVHWSVLLSMMNSSEISYPERSDENSEFLRSVFGQDSHEFGTEVAAFNIYYLRPEYSEVEGVSQTKRSIRLKSCIEKVLVTNRNQCTLV